MKRETLTAQDIKYDLQYMLTGNYKGLALGTVIFLVFLMIAVWAYDEGDSILLFVLFFGFLPAAYLVFLVLHIADTVKLHRVLKNELMIVRDSVIGMEVKEGLCRKRSRRIYFTGYGIYEIPRVNYTWSKYHSNDGWVYQFSEHGDEFYLVLSKPHTGKLLLAYNTRWFELQK